ncbi:phosphomevalonate kinase [Phlyctochytrium planicorne]|nr:phosphomevalonate kinase [Phlyctochytrium planicorne]
MMGCDNQTTTVSAPGKVLITGGYLVLDQEYSGLVVGTNARFYTTVAPRSVGEGAARIVVKSPQFLDGQWEYSLQVQADRCQITPTTGARNRYVECALVHSLNAALVLSKNFGDRSKAGIDIVIVGDNDFYSQRAQLKLQNLPLNTKSLASLERFCSTLTTIPKVSKTGLGSSAAMITSLTGALLHYFGVVNLKQDNTSEHDLQLVHNVAQFAHCLAQGKIGSGFDVSAAAFGSHSYKRFSPKALSDILKETIDPLADDTLLATTIVDNLDPAKSQKWDSKVVRFSLPPGIKMMLADIDCGSSTPKLVSEVLKWRANSPEEARALWTTLHQKNQACENILRSLHEDCRKTPEVYAAALESAANPDKSNPVSQKLNELTSTFSVVRSLLRDMSAKAGVPIEPPEQTRLLDACMNVPGVILAGVPGAGGFDAIFVLYVESKILSPRDNIERVWSSWTEMDVGPLLADEDFTGIRLDSLSQ